MDMHTSRRMHTVEYMHACGYVIVCVGMRVFMYMLVYVNVCIHGRCVCVCVNGKDSLFLYVLRSFSNSDSYCFFRCRKDYILCL